MKNTTYQSWGGVFKAEHEIYRPAFLDSLQGFKISESLLAYGNGRSYGDVCLNSNGRLMDMKGMDRLLAFDRESGVIECQAGILLSDLLKFIVSNGFFVPVTPGTANVTVGGMIANDVHGKNHHRKGSFGNHVLGFTLLRSDQGLVYCSASANPQLFHATIGGLGLTGIILTVQLRLRRIANNCIQSNNRKTLGLDEMLEELVAADADNEYTVAWLDVRSDDLPGVLSAGNHAEGHLFCKYKQRNLSVPIHAPNWLLNSTTNHVFNWLYYRKEGLRQQHRQYYGSFFYPLDALDNWNRLYGRRGFFQYQFVVPCDSFAEVFVLLREIMRKYNQYSYLSVLKKFGDIPSIGMLSFPRDGYTLAMDFPNLGQTTLDMFNEFDAVVFSAAGALYPAKDARMDRQAFERSFPKFDDFMAHKDPFLTSDFWRRVME